MPIITQSINEIVSGMDEQYINPRCFVFATVPSLITNSNRKYIRSLHIQNVAFSLISEHGADE